MWTNQVIHCAEIGVLHSPNHLKDEEMKSSAPSSSRKYDHTKNQMEILVWSKPVLAVMFLSPRMSYVHISPIDICMLPPVLALYIHTTSFSFRDELTDTSLIKLPAIILYLHLAFKSDSSISVPKRFSALSKDTRSNKRQYLHLKACRKSDCS